MPPRLLQRQRPSAASADPAAQLPPYEPPAYPMNDKGKREVEALGSDQDSRILLSHFKKSADFLKEGVWAINNLLVDRRTQLSGMIEKREVRAKEQGIEIEKPEIETQLEEYIAQLEATVERLTDTSESAMRKLVDLRVGIEDQSAVLKMTKDKLGQQVPRPEPAAKKKRAKRESRMEEDEGDAEEDEHEDVEMEEAANTEPVRGVIELLQASKETKLQEYQSMTPYERYGKNNEYISFKNAWHDALHQKDQKPLPHASTWFDSEGRPTRTAEDDDELVVARVVIDTRCPLSQSVMRQPYGTKACKHVFEKEAILEYLQINRGTAKCPVPGCSADIRKNELRLDDLMLKRLKRAQQEEQAAVDATSDISEDEDNDASVIVGHDRNVKRERTRP